MLYANGYPVGGGGGGSEIIDGIDGVFIDTENVIQASTSYTTTTSYTATEDCFVMAILVSNSNNSCAVYIDDEVVFTRINGQPTYYNELFLLKKGQTITLNTQNYTQWWTTAYTVYGIQTGTTHSKFQPVIYSLEEREIGVWTDGKPLYEKTLAIPSLSAGSNTIQHNIANFDKMISCQGRINYDGDDLVVPYMQTQVTSGYVAYGIGISNFNSTRYFIILGNMFDVSKFSGGYVTVRYTKTTDVAGSGTWTPQGVPTHHYSTDEQVIGTYFGDTLYQKTIVLSSGVSIADSWTTIYTDALIGTIAQLVDCKYNNVENKGVYGVLNFKPNGNNLQAVYPISGGLSVLAGARFTLKYTKSS